MNRKASLVVSIVLICALSAAILVTALTTPSQQPTKELDFIVSGSSDCLRFLNSSVPTVYVPFTLAANENWQLTINCTKMPGGVNGYTDVYLYKGYWNRGNSKTRISSDLYPIISDIQSTDHQIRLSNPFTQTFARTNCNKATPFSLWFHQADNKLHST